VLVKYISLSKTLIELIPLCCDIISIGIYIAIKHCTLLFSLMDVMLHVLVLEGHHQALNIKNFETHVHMHMDW
jgi:hypothetical protein